MALRVVSLAHYETRPCRSYACPNEAEPGSDLCMFCARVEKGAFQRRHVDLHEAVMALVPLLARVEIEQERDVASADYRAAVHELRRGLRTAATAVAGL